MAEGNFFIEHLGLGQLGVHIRQALHPEEGEEEEVDGIQGFLVDGQGFKGVEVKAAEFQVADALGQIVTVALTAA